MTSEMIAARYEVRRPLGEGAMGLVSLVLDTIAEQEMALKVISSQMGANENAILQFKQEFRLMAQLRHPNCCEVYDFGVMPDGSPFFTMEVVPGYGLDERLPLPREQVKPVLTQLLLALGYVHQVGFVHRDIKNANVRVRPDGVVKLMDFGLMEHTGRTGAPISGTVGYMAPEIVKRGAIDQRTDLYSVGCLAYEMLTGRVPFLGDRPLEVLRAHVSDAPMPPSRFASDIEPELEQIVMRLLAKEPIERFQSAYEVLEALGADVPAGLGGSLLSSPLVGQERVLGILTAKIEAVAARQPTGAVVLQGAPGIGKSRLVHEVRFRAQLEHLPCAKGQAFDRSQAPYAPFIAVLRGMLPSLREQMPELVERHAPILSKLLPELGVTPAPELEPSSREKARLQSALTEVFVALAVKTGLVVILEDWQWADALSAEFLEYLLRNAAEAPLFVLVTSRLMSEASTNAAGATQTVRLEALDGDGVHRMVSSMLGTERIPATLAKKVQDHTHGNPFYIEELLEHLVRSQFLVKAHGTWELAVDFTGEQLPTSLHGLLLEKLADLSKAAESLLDAAAVAGFDFSLDLLRRVVGMPDDAFLEAFEELNRHQVLVNDEWGFWRFAQDELQKLVYNRLPDERKSAIHAAIAEALEDAWGPIGLGDVPLEGVTSVAHHYLQAGVRERAIIFSLEAGVRHASLFANVEAEKFLTAGLSLLRDGDEDGWQSQKLDFLRVLGDVRRVMGDPKGAIVLYEEATALARDLAALHWVGTLLTSQAKVHQNLENLDQALACCEESLAIGLDTEDPVGATRSLLTSSRIHFFKGNREEAIAHTEQALQTAQAGGDVSRIGEAMSFLGYLYTSFIPEKRHIGLEYLHQAVAMLTELGDKMMLNNIFILLGNVQRTLGDFEGAHHSFLQVQRIAKETNSKPDLAMGLINSALTCLERGNFSEAIECLGEAHDLAAQIDNKFILGVAKAFRGSAQGRLWLFDEALSALVEVLTDARATGNKYLEGLVLSQLVEVQLLSGDLASARSTAMAWQTLIADAQNPEQESLLNVCLGEIMGREGNPEAAKSYADHALNSARQGQICIAEIRALHLKAWLALRTEDWQAGVTHALEALKLADGCGAKHLTAELRGVLGELALAQGDDQAWVHYEAMRACAEDVQSPGLLAIALFGLASARPYASSASDLASRAKGHLENATAFRSPEFRQHLLSVKELRRILEGRYVEMSLPIRKKAESGPLGRAFGMGGPGW